VDVITLLGLCFSYLLFWLLSWQRFASTWASILYRLEFMRIN